MSTVPTKRKSAVGLKTAKKMSSPLTSLTAIADRVKPLNAEYRLSICVVCAVFSGVGLDRMMIDTKVNQPGHTAYVSDVMPPAPARLPAAPATTTIATEAKKVATPAVTPVTAPASEAGDKPAAMHNPDGSLKAKLIDQTVKTGQRQQKPNQPQWTWK